MNAAELLEQIEAAGGMLTLKDGERIAYDVPEEIVPLVAELRARKSDVLKVLQEREKPSAKSAASKSKEALWPSTSLDAELRFGQPHARLFPFIGRKVQTPAGPGTLLQAFAERVTVLLDSELRRCSFFRPVEIQPVSWEI